MDQIFRFFRIIFKFAAGLFIGLHLYALALKFLPAPGTFLMMQRAIEGNAVVRTTVPLERISPHLVRAVIAAEDTRFCAHEGVDTDAIRTAIKEYEEGQGLRGASTITQQTAKNVFFWNGGGLPRKAGDAWMAVFVDWVWGKRRVMETYLNVAEWGDGLFGAEAAARARFGKSAADLTEREAALLATVLPSPNKWRVDPPGPYVAKRAGTVQARMRIVASQKLDACIWGEAEPKLKPAPRQPVPDAPKDAEPAPPSAPVIPEEEDPFESLPLEPSPEVTRSTEPEDDLAPMVSPNDEATEALNDFLNAAEETFEPPAQPEASGTSDGNPAQDDTTAEGTDSGPTELRPRRVEE